MFGPIGGPELILILVLALMLFGPRKLPQIGRTLGKALSEFRSVTHEFKSTLDREVALSDLRETKNDLKSTAAEVKGIVSGTPREPEPVAPAKRDSESDPPKSVTPDGGSVDTP
jgi:Tat protein translocase TatB subunit